LLIETFTTAAVCFFLRIIVPVQKSILVEIVLLRSGK